MCIYVHINDRLIITPTLIESLNVDVKQNENKI